MTTPWQAALSQIRADDTGERPAITGGRSAGVRRWPGLRRYRRLIRGT
jgi:hypothetical protein